MSRWLPELVAYASPSRYSAGIGFTNFSIRATRTARKYIGPTLLLCALPTQFSCAEDQRVPGDSAGITDIDPSPQDSSGDTSTSTSDTSTLDSMSTSSTSDDSSSESEDVPVVVSVTAGGDSSCAIWSDGRLQCWGNNIAGQLGLGHTRSIGNRPGDMGAELPLVELPSGTHIARVELAETTCAATNEGILYCWGANQHGQLGAGHDRTIGDEPGEMGSKLFPVPLGVNRSVTDHCVGGGHACALFEDGDVKCWGRNDHGQLGRGNTDPIGASGNQMGDFLAIIDLGTHPGEVTRRSATSIACGRQHSCVTTDLGEVLCWGRNHKGQLGIGSIESKGDGAAEMGDALIPVKLGDKVQAVEVVAGEHHTCARTQAGNVHCWGINEQGQLGNGSKEALGAKEEDIGRLRSSVNLGSGVKAIKLDADLEHTCALTSDARLFCWGDNRLGTLGLGDPTQVGDEPGEMGNSLIPVDLGVDFEITTMSAGTRHTCAFSAQGVAKCWGYNISGQLGQGNEQTIGDLPGQMGDALAPVDLQRFR